MNKIILASASPRRKELLKLIVPDFLVIPSLKEEIVPEGMDAENIPVYLAEQKAKNILDLYSGYTVIGADTAVIANGEILGKPKNKADALRMLELLSGRTHKVITGCVICSGEKTVSFSSVTAVEFYELSKPEMQAYASTEEPYDKAGGYGIQGKAGLFVKKIDGDYYNVVGLPISELNRKLRLFNGG